MLTAAPTQFRRRFLVRVWLLILLSHVGCVQAAQVTQDNAVGAHSRRAPIDVDASTTEGIGREALEKIGYEEIIKLADKAGFVAYKSNVTIQLVSYDSTVAAGFVPVFSRYAAAAAVAAQADSPLPGPADLAAVGVLVIGLVDAGLLDGSLIKAVGKLLGTTGEATVPVTVSAEVPGYPCRPCSSPRAACSRVDYVPPSRPHYPCAGDHTHNYTFIMDQNPRTCECYERPQDEIVCSNNPRHPETNPCP